MPCTFSEIIGQQFAGIRCPMCGGTTAWAHVVRGEFLKAAQTNLAATLLCAAVVVGSPLAIVMALVGMKTRRWPTLRFALVIASVWSAVAVLDWLRKLV